VDERASDRMNSIAMIGSSGGDLEGEEKGC